MSTACGKAARKNGGNRFDVMRRNRRKKHEKVYSNNAMAPEQYRAMKLSERKALAKASR